MTIEISTTILYIIASVIILSLVIFLIAKRHTKSSGSSELQNNKSNDRQEKKRREKAAKEIEARLNTELDQQLNLVKDYIGKLRFRIEAVDKKIFYNITKNSQTDPIGLFHKLRRIFELNSDDRVYYCRRNNTTFGADDFFIISEKGFSFGDSNGENWTLEFDEVSKTIDLGPSVIFEGYDDSYTSILLWEYILYNETHQEKADFIELTNDFLAKYETAEDIYERAAISAFYNRAVPLLERLTEFIGTDSLKGKFIRAAYHYALAGDFVHTDHNLEQARYLLLEVENQLEKWAKEEGMEVRGHRLYGECKYWEARVAWRSGEDSYVLQQALKELQGKEYDEEVREAAAAMYGEVFHNN